MSDGKATRRAFLGLGIVGAGGAVAAATTKFWRPAAQLPAATARASAAQPGRTTRRVVPENSLPGDAHWRIRHLGAQADVEGYAGRESVLSGESFPLFVSSTSKSVKVTAYRLGWYGGDGARKVWHAGSVSTGRQKAAAMTSTTSTIHTDWDPVVHVPTHDWPEGAYLIRLDAESGAQRYVPITVRSASTAGKVVIKHAVQTWQAYNMWGGYDLYKGPGQDYAIRSLAVSLDRPYDTNGAEMFLTYERNLVKFAEQLGLSLAYVTGTDIANDPHLLDGASALISPGHDEYWTPAERANVTAARNKGVNLAFFGANALFRRTRLASTTVGSDRLVVCYKTSYTSDPMYGVDNTLVTSDWRGAPHADPESSLIGTIYEGYPADAAFVVSSPKSWIYSGTGVSAGASFPHLVGIEYDRVNPAYPTQRPIEVLSHSPLTCQGKASYADSAYYTRASGAGVYNCGTMRWVEALYGDEPHGIGGQTPAFVRQVTSNILRAFADGPAAAKYPARDNLVATHEFFGDPIGNSASLQ
jgi:hypothetical protein